MQSMQVATGIVLAVGFDGEATLPRADAVGALVLICVFIAGGYLCFRLRQ